MKFEIYTGENKASYDYGQHFWRLRARNGRIIADGSEGYKRHSECVKAVQRIQKGVPSATIKDTNHAGR